MWCFRASVATSEIACRLLSHVFRHAVVSYSCQDCMAYRPQPRLFADSGSLQKGTENDEELVRFPRDSDQRAESSKVRVVPQADINRLHWN